MALLYAAHCAGWSLRICQSPGGGYRIRAFRLKQRESRRMRMMGTVVSRRAFRKCGCVYALRPAVACVNETVCGKPLVTK